MSKLTALIADDVEGLRALLKTHLRQFDCTVIKEVEDGGKVIAAVEKYRPDIVFLDINMPTLDGISILKHLSENNIHRDVWIISGDTDDETKHYALQHGARGFIEKPFNTAKLKQTFSDFRLTSNTGYVEKIKKTVMVVDDEPLMRKLLKSVLEKLDCNVKYEASSGKEAISFLHGNASPDIVFLDIEMPDIDGLEVLNIIKQEKIPTFVVMVSAHSTFENVQAAMGSGADGFVVKPYSDKKISQVIAKYEKESVK